MGVPLENLVSLAFQVHQTWGQGQCGSGVSPGQPLPLIVNGRAEPRDREGRDGSGHQLPNYCVDPDRLMTLLPKLYYGDDSLTLVCSG